MVSVNINEKLWDNFLKQSIDLKKSASERISDFIKKELASPAPEFSSKCQKTDSNHSHCGGAGDSKNEDERKW